MKSEVSIVDIAKKLNLSATTVSLALRDLKGVSPQTLALVQKTAQELGYTPNRTAQMLRARRHSKSEGQVRGVIACITGHADRDRLCDPDHVYNDAYREIVKQAEIYDYKVESIWYYSPDMRPERLQHILKHKGIEGIILLGIGAEEIDFNWNDFATVYALKFGVFEDFQFSTTWIDRYLYLKMATKKLLDLGYKKIALAKGFTESDELDHLLSASLLFHSNSSSPKLIHGWLDAPEKTEKSFLKAFQKDPPDAIISYRCSLSMLELLKKHKYRLGEEVGLFELLLSGDSERANISGFSIPFEKAGRVAVDTLVALLTANKRGFSADPCRVVFSPDYIKGNTLRDCSY